MNPLRQRMIEDMQLRTFSEKTQHAQVRPVRQLAEHCGKSPDLVSEGELRLSSPQSMAPSILESACQVTRQTRRAAAHPADLPPPQALLWE